MEKQLAFADIQMPTVRTSVDPAQATETESLREMQKPVLGIPEAQQEKFWKNVNKEGTCWVWRGARDNQGRPTFSLGRIKRSRTSFNVLCQRALYRSYRGTIPEAGTIKMACANRLCVNPRHMIACQRNPSTARGSFCKNGHPRTIENTRSHHGYTICQTCENERTKRWREKTNGSVSSSSRKRRMLYKLVTRYRMTQQEFDALVKKQNGRCAICGKKSSKLCLDHDHLTQKARGLLCYSCNSGVGMFGDNAQLLIAALDYLIEWEIIHSSDFLANIAEQVETAMTKGLASAPALTPEVKREWEVALGMLGGMR